MALNDIDELQRRLETADLRSYPAYKRLAGRYDLDGFALSIDHVQGDPFAAPSSLSVEVGPRAADWPTDLHARPWQKTALEDFLLRRFSRALAARSYRAGGSGKSGFLGTSRPGPEVLRRSSCEVADDGTVIARFEAGFPARGRTTDARALARMLLDLVPDAVDEALVADDAALERARAAVELADDQRAVRKELESRGLVAFVADGSALPRESGASARPLRGAVPFRAPEGMATVLELPHRGRVRGMAVAEGITLIVGGGYHGKSTLLRALQEGVYDHVAGDGRELVITRADAVKLRAEDGRPVHGVDISLFIGDLPDGRDTRRFFTGNASGSTSQAAGCIEAVQTGCRALLIDEDTSATNFMVRDRVMEAVVARDQEPITPFVERVRDLWERGGVSCVIVAGSSGAFFSVADAVVQMDRYEARDITQRARETCQKIGAPATPRATGFTLPSKRPRSERLALAVRSEPDRPRPPHGPRGGRGRKDGSGRSDERRMRVRVQGLDELQVGDGGVDTRLLEQLVDVEQAAALAQMVRVAATRGMLDGSLDAEDVARAIFDLMESHGWSSLAPNGRAAAGLALPRPQELMEVLLRWRDR